MSALDQLVRVSQVYGKDPDFVLAGGGNTSVKVKDILYIKPSGTTLAEITKKDFVAIDRKKIRDTLIKKYDSNPFRREDQIKKDLLEARLDYKPNHIGPRASVETALHELIDYKFVVHTHPNLVNGLTCGLDGKQIAHELFGKDFVWIEYTDPGFTLAKVVEKRLNEYMKSHDGAAPNIILLQNHGLIISDNTIEGIHKHTRNVVRKIRSYRNKKTKNNNAVFKKVTNKTVSGANLEVVLNTVSPALRGLLCADTRKIITFDNSALVKKVVTSENGKQVMTRGTFSPDHMVYCKEKPLWIDCDIANGDREKLAARVQAAVKNYKAKNPFDPKIVFIGGVGMLSIGDSYKEAKIAESLYKDLIKVAINTASFGGPKYFNRRQAKFIEEWEVESYRKKLIRDSSAGRVQNRVAIVTGSGQGIGEGIALGLAKEGAYVIVADLNLKTAQNVAQRINNEYGAGKALAVKVDITSTKEVQRMVLEIVINYGGIDVVVSNAGILISGPTEQLSDEQFNILTQVNYQGFFRMVRECAGVMKTQNTVNPDYSTDIVLLSSKSGLQGSPANALYAGSKFGGIGLMQSFALEFVKNGIKANAVCPGNYFEGPLWSDPVNGLFVQYLKAGKVPGAKNIADVKKYYEARCPMGKGISTEDINKAVIYAIDQQYETGQAIPVTGGQVMLK